MLNPLGGRAPRQRLSPRRVRPGLHRPGSAEGGPSGLLSVLALSAAVGAVVGMAAAGRVGAFAVLRPVVAPAPAANQRPLALNAGLLFPPPVPKTVERRVDVYDPPPAAPRTASVAAPAAAAPKAAPSVTAQPAPSPSPPDDGGGGDDH